MAVIYVLPRSIFVKLFPVRILMEAGIIENRSGRPEAIYYVVSKQKVVVIPGRGTYAERRLKTLYDAGIIKRVIVR